MAAGFEAMLQMANGMQPCAAPGNGGLPAPPQGMDAAVAAQAYMQMFQYLQQGFASQQNLATGAMLANGTPGVPPRTFPGMTPYAPQQAAPPEPSISVSVEGMTFQYQLTEDDLQKVFSRYGAVSHIKVDEVGASAIITFMLTQDAQAAMNDLNGKVLNGLDGTLRINWHSQPPAVPPPYPSMGGFPGFGSPLAGFPQGMANMAASMPPVAGQASGTAGQHGAGHSAKGVRKYTCRFMIGIENDKDFQVARRIIGAKGANMKRVVKQTEAKLRLRGAGSGYFEGAGQKESAEPLQLCVSCTSLEGYRLAVAQVEELLKRVYEEYKQYCIDTGRPLVNVEINLSENALVYSKLVGGSSAVDDGSPKRPTNRRGGNQKNRGSRRVEDAQGEGGRGEPGPNAPSPEEIEKYIDDRNEARRANNFQEADRIRELLHNSGVALMDEPGGRGKGAEVTTWRYWRD